MCSQRKRRAAPVRAASGRCFSCSPQFRRAAFPNLTIFSLRLWRRTRARPALLQDAVDKQPNVNVNKQNDGFLIGLLNTQSLSKVRPIAVSDAILTRHLDALAVTETWHHASDDISLKRCAPPGYSIVDAARSVTTSTQFADRGGGIAVIYNDRFAAKKIVFDAKPTTFEVLGCSLRSASVIVVHVVIYRPGTKPATEEFFTELTALLEIVVTSRNELVITGDFNIHVNDDTDWRSRRLAEILESFGLLQAVSGSTHQHSQQRPQPEEIMEVSVNSFEKGQKLVYHTTDANS